MLLGKQRNMQGLEGVWGFHMLEPLSLAKDGLEIQAPLQSERLLLMLVQKLIKCTLRAATCRASARSTSLRI